MAWDYWWIWKDKDEQQHYKEALERIQTDPLLMGAVTFDQFGADVASWLRKIGCILSTSDDESFHLSPAEGMASGTTSVVLPWAGSDEVYGTPWVVADVDEAAQRILEQADADEWEVRRSAAMKHVAAFDLPRVVEAWADIIAGDRDASAWP
jgi:dihydrofolate reductase